MELASVTGDNNEFDFGGLRGQTIESVGEGEGRVGHVSECWLSLSSSMLEV